MGTEQKNKQMVAAKLSSASPPLLISPATAAAPLAYAAPTPQHISGVTSEARSLFISRSTELQLACTAWRDLRWAHINFTSLFLWHRLIKSD